MTIGNNFLYMQSNIKKKNFFLENRAQIGLNAGKIIFPPVF